MYNPAMNSAEFVEELERENAEVIGRMAAAPPAESSTSPDVLALLRIALKNELEASELAAHWMPSTPELDVKLGLARQVGDEAKHYRLLEARYRELGGDPAFDPRQGGYSQLFEYLTALHSSVERLAAGQFTREAIAERRNAMFIDYLDSVGDGETARLYREIIQPDEEYHHQLGRAMLLRYATTTQLQEAARAACRKTLEIAEKLRAGAVARTGVYQIPGC
jgi:1,2-phenylacetyl-CoA epoxidase catalytic subunit